MCCQTAGLLFSCDYFLQAVFLFFFCEGGLEIKVATFTTLSTLQMRFFDGRMARQ